MTVAISLQITSTVRFDEVPRESWGMLLFRKLESITNELLIDAPAAVRLVDEVERFRAFEVDGFSSLDEWLEKQVELPPSRFRLIKAGVAGGASGGAAVCEEHGRELLTPAEKGKLGGRGNKAVRDCEQLSTQTQDRSYNLARLDRDRPDLAASVRAGDLSANAAAVQAGFRKPPSPLAQLRSAWKRASDEDKAVFRRETAG